MRSHDQGGRFAIPDALILMYNLQPSSVFFACGVVWPDPPQRQWHIPLEALALRIHQRNHTGKRLAGVSCGPILASIGSPFP